MIQRGSGSALELAEAGEPDASRYFAQLRELLYQEPSAESWWELCRLFAIWPEEDLKEGIDYACAHLEEWPEELRVAPALWAQSLYDESPDVRLRLTARRDFCLHCRRLMPVEPTTCPENRWGPSGLCEKPEHAWMGAKITDLAFSPAGDLLAIATHSSIELRRWPSLERVAEYHDRDLPHRAALRCAFSPGGDVLAVVGGADPVMLLDIMLSPYDDPPFPLELVFRAAYKLPLWQRLRQEQAIRASFLAVAFDRHGSLYVAGREKCGVFSRMELHRSFDILFSASPEISPLDVCILPHQGCWLVGSDNYPIHVFDWRQRRRSSIHQYLSEDQWITGTAVFGFGASFCGRWVAFGGKHPNPNVLKLQPDAFSIDETGLCGSGGRERILVCGLHPSGEWLAFCDLGEGCKVVTRAGGLFDRAYRLPGYPGGYR